MKYDNKKETDLTTKIIGVLFIIFMIWSILTQAADDEPTHPECSYQFADC